ncbi:MAG: immunoglobulin domain-containing protein [Opitutaceae bacterium]
MSPLYRMKGAVAGVYMVAVLAGLTTRAAGGVSAIAVGQYPSAIAVNPVTNKIYVETGADTMVVIDGATGATTTVDAGANGGGILVNPVTNKIYITNGPFSGIESPPFVVVIDGATNACTPIADGSTGSIALNSVTNKIYVSDVGNSGVVTVIDGATNAATTVDLGNGTDPGAVAVNPVTNRVYVSNGDNVDVIDGATGAVTAIPLGVALGDIGVNPATNKIYVGTASSVVVIDGATNTFTTIPVGGYADILVNPVSNTIYAEEDNLAVIDGATNAFTVIPLASHSYDIAIDPATNKAFLVDGKNLVAIDGTTNVASTIAVGSNPDAVAVDSATGTVYVSNSGSGNVSVVDEASIPFAPGFLGEPGSQTVNAGSSVVFSAQASGNPLPACQWSYDGTPLADGAGVAGSSTSILYLSGASAKPGSYTCTATNSAGSATSSAATLAAASSSMPGRLVDISARALVGTGSNNLIAGYVIEGSAALPVLIRSSGPALAPLGVAGTLPDPRLQLYSGAAVVDGNAGWGGNSQITSIAEAVGAFSWTSATSKDSALLETQVPGSYTAVTSGASGDTGIALAEVYDATPSGTWVSSFPRLVNISARASVGTGESALIAGFVIEGSTPETVLVRASGPALTPLNVAGVLPDPEIQLYSGSTVIASNVGWGGGAALSAAAKNVGAFTWSDPSSNDSALLVTLSPGAYSAVVTGASGDTGVSLVEVYEVP